MPHSTGRSREDLQDARDTARDGTDSKAKAAPRFTAAEAAHRDLLGRLFGARDAARGATDSKAKAAPRFTAAELAAEAARRDLLGKLSAQGSGSTLFASSRRGRASGSALFGPES